MRGRERERNENVNKRKSKCILADMLDDYERGANEIFKEEFIVFFLFLLRSKVSFPVEFVGQETKSFSSLKVEEDLKIEFLFSTERIGR